MLVKNSTSKENRLIGVGRTGVEQRRGQIADAVKPIIRRIWI